MIDSLVGWVVTFDMHKPDGPYSIIGKTNNGWVTFKERKAARLSDVYYSEQDALIAILENLEIKKRIINRRITVIESMLKVRNDRT